MKVLPWGPTGQSGILGHINALMSSFNSIPETMAKSTWLLKKGRGFQFASLVDGQITVLSPKLIDWYARQPPDQLSMVQLQGERLQQKFTMNDSFAAHGSNLDLEKLIIRSMTLHSKTVIPGLHEEIELASPMAFPSVGDDWESVCLGDAISEVIAATTTRLSVGAPICESFDPYTSTLKSSSHF